jgi:hypothetical protein
MAPEPEKDLEQDWKNPPKALITVAKFFNSTEAQLAGTKLLSEGIWSFVADENMGSLYSAANFFLGGIRLQVKAADLPKALVILGLPAQVCPSCGAQTNASPLFCGNCGKKLT